MTDPGHTKQTVIAYLNTALNDKRPAEAVEKYSGSHYTQHNPQAPDGFDAFIQLTHSLLKTSPEDRGTAVGEIFRLEDGKMVEHRDVLQYPRTQRTTTPCSDSDSYVTSEGSRGTAAARTLTTLTTAMIQERDVLRHSLKCLEGRCCERRPDGVRYTQRRTLAL